MQKLLIIALTIFLLSGCFGAFVAGVGIGGVVVNDERSIETMTRDKNIAHQARLKLTADKEINENTHIVVASFNRIVLLVGQAPNETLRYKATDLVKTVPNIRRIYNEITLSGPISTLTESSDAWLTTKVKTQLLAAAGLKAAQIKVVTENGVIYLMGLVTRSQAEQAVNIARQVAGAQRVVKIFEYKE